jgi:pimeloyl-ACP methyl ester carboxylesterase
MTRPLKTLTFSKESNRTPIGVLEHLNVKQILPPYVYHEKAPIFTVQKAEPEKREGKSLHKYHIDLPLDHALSEYHNLGSFAQHDQSVAQAFGLDMKAVTLTVWSEKELDLTDMQSFRDALQYKQTGNFATLFGSGYLATPEQLDRQSSFVEAFSKSMHRKNNHTTFNNVIIGYSCLGFEGSETVNEPTKDSIGVVTYERLKEALLYVLSPDRAALVGHSAGGAATMYFVHEMLNGPTATEIEKNPVRQHLYDVIRKIPVAPVALHPALNKKSSWQFATMKDLNQLKFWVGLDEENMAEFRKNWPRVGKFAPDDFATRKVVKIALGLNPWTTGTQDEEDQVTLHCDMLARFPHAGYAKLHDLFVPHERGDVTTKKTAILTGELDRITMIQQILSGIESTRQSNERDGKVKKVALDERKKQILREAQIINIQPTHHDQFCYDPKWTRYYADYVADNVIRLVT